MNDLEYYSLNSLSTYFKIPNPIAPEIKSRITNNIKNTIIMRLFLFGYKFCKKHYQLCTDY